ncbi:MAG: hypothetical protein GF308_20990 [Candidatus Heimdallarchaeota archaeon]|nr:hypothetical protein [Candidatus Heimdallarchaeota archaeon]
MDKSEQKREKVSSHKSKPNISPSEEEIIYSALGSPIRREILLFIKERKKVGFVELRDQFGLKVGSLYHQLNSMEKLLTQDENKKYFPTELGELACELLVINKDHLAASQATSAKRDKKLHPFLEKVINLLSFFFLPRPVFEYFSSEPIRTFFEGLIIIGAMLFFSIDGRRVLIGFFPFEVNEWYYSLIGVLGLWVGLFLLSDFLKTIFYHQKFGSFKLFAVIPFTMIPNVIVLFCLWLQDKLTTIFLVLDAQLLIIFGQIWALSLMVTAVSKTEKLTMKRASLIVLFSFYVIYLVSFVIVGTS